MIGTAIDIRNSMVYISPQDWTGHFTVADASMIRVCWKWSEVLSIYQRHEKELLHAQRSATIAWGVVCLGGARGVLVECFSTLNTTSTTLRSSLRLSGPRLDAGCDNKIRQSQIIMNNETTFAGVNIHYYFWITTTPGIILLLGTSTTTIVRYRMSQFSHLPHNMNTQSKNSPKFTPGQESSLSFAAPMK